MSTDSRDFPQGCVCVEKDGDSDSRSCFPIGSLFAASTTEIPCTSHCRQTVVLNIPKALTLKITSANHIGDDSRYRRISVSTDVTSAIPLCNIPPNSTVSGLGLVLVGPQQVKLTLDNGVSVIGSVSPSSFEYKKIQTNIEASDARQENKALVSEKTTTESRIVTQATSKKRKLSIGDSTDKDATPNDRQEQSSPKSQNDESNTSATATEPTTRLSKRQRKKLAKKKAKELSEAVAFLNKHESKVESNNNNNDKTASTKKTASLTKERRLPSGVFVKDIIVGTGAPVKLGRKVSILYEGAFTNGKVFDRNRNRNSPLTFRQGTGQVIKGLEKGIEGMRMGGEREITIPPEQGYGKKGSGNVVPPNSTLVFSVQLVGIGG